MIEMIVCADTNNAIGKNNDLLCKLSDDLKYFKEMTVGKYVVMGRNTWESIGSKPLSDRFNVILSKTMEKYVSPSKFVIVDDIDVIVELNKKFPDLNIMIMGGAKVYEAFLPYASKIYLTRVHNTFEDADTFFPLLDFNEWNLEEMSKIHLADEKNEYNFHHETFIRK